MPSQAIEKLYPGSLFSLLFPETSNTILYKSLSSGFVKISNSAFKGISGNIRCFCFSSFSSNGIASKKEPGWMWTESSSGSLKRIDSGDVPRLFKEKTYVGLKGLCCVTYPEYYRTGNLIGKNVGLYDVQNPLASFEVRSKKLAKIRGTFPAWDSSNYDKEAEQYRNHCRLTVAPTGTISMIADTSSGIEPTFALAWKKQNILEGKTLNYINKYFEADAKKYGFYSEDLMDYLANGGVLATVPEVPDWVKAVYVTAPEISPEDHVLMQSAFQKSVDSGISKTINFANKATQEDIEKTYILAWKEGCKGITVYRAGSREKEVLVKGNNERTKQLKLDGFELEDSILGEKENYIVPLHNCCDNQNMVFESGCETCKSCGYSACLIS